MQCPNSETIPNKQVSDAHHNKLHFSEREREREGERGRERHADRHRDREAGKWPSITSCLIPSACQMPFVSELPKTNRCVLWPAAAVYSTFRNNVCIVVLIQECIKEKWSGYFFILVRRSIDFLRTFLQFLRFNSSNAFSWKGWISNPDGKVWWSGEWRVRRPILFFIKMIKYGSFY